MAGLSELVNQWLSQGYSQDFIGDYLSRYGYSRKDINEALKSADFNLVKHEHHIAGSSIVFFTFMLLLGSALMLALLTLGGVIGKEALLDLELTPGQPSDSIPFTLRILNLGEKERFDVSVEYFLTHESGEIIASQQETFALSTSSTREKSLTMPEAPGRYTVKAVASYDGKQAVSSFSFTVEGTSKTEILRNESLPGENQTAHDNDSGRGYRDTIAEVEKTAASMPSESENLCLEIKDADDRDDCLSLVVSKSRRPEFCENIYSPEARDNCFMSFIVESQTHLCSKIVLESNQEYCSRVKDVEILAKYY